MTISSKKVNGRIYHGTDCLILSKDAGIQEVSEGIFKSAQKSIGELYGRLAERQIHEKPNTNFMTKISNVFKKLFQILKKF